MGIASTTKTTGQKLSASDWNNLLTDLTTGKFFDSAGAGSNYNQVAHNGTDATLSTNTGHQKVNAPTGKEVKLQVNGADVVQAAGSLVTLSQALKVPDGSVGTPGLHFNGDTDTGLGLVSSKLALIFGGAVKANNDGTTWDLQSQALTTSGNISTSSSGVVTGAGGVKCKASGTGSDTLSTYESAGTFTPVLRYATVGTSTWTFSSQTGFYERIGSLVRVHGSVSWTAHTKGTGSGALRLTGFPYTTVNTAGKGSVGPFLSYGVTPPTGGVHHVLLVAENTNFGIFYSSSMASGTSSGLSWDPATAGFAVGAAGTINFDCWMNT